MGCGFELDCVLTSSALITKKAFSRPKIRYTRDKRNEPVAKLLGALRRIRPVVDFRTQPQ